MKGAFAIAAIAFALASSAFAQSPPVVAPMTFRVGGVELKFVLPEGYCLPIDKYIDIAQLTSAADDVNVTDLTLYHCDANGITDASQLLIKTPKNLLLTDVGRREALDGLGAAFDKPEFASALASGSIDSEASKSMAKVFGDNLTVKSQITPLGKDDICAYLGGALSGSANNESYTGAFAACMTVVKTRFLVVYVYGPYAGAQSVIALVPKAKAVARMLIDQNE